LSNSSLGYGDIPVDEVIAFGEDYISRREAKLQKRLNDRRESYNKKWYSRFIKFDEHEAGLEIGSTGWYWYSCVNEVLESAKVLKSRGTETMSVSTDILSMMSAD